MANAANQPPKTYDLVVIGGGPAGYASALAASRHGVRTAVIERSELGGTCLNRGCIPTKTYLKTAEMVHHLTGMRARGISIADPAFSVDLKTALQHKNSIVKKLTAGVAQLLKASGVEIIRSTGVLENTKAIRLDSGEIVFAEKVILAGGSVPASIAVPGIDHPSVLTSDEILDLPCLPQRLAIIGGGVIGVEMASIFNAFGSEVFIFEMADRLLPLFDEEISRSLERQLKKAGVRIKTDTAIQSIASDGEAAVLHSGGGQSVLVDSVLVATGRVPDLSAIGGLKIATSHGMIDVDNHMRTSVKSIWAPGDVNGRLMLAHAAFAMAEVAVNDAFNLKPSRPFKPQHIPICVYSNPEIACIGMNEHQASETYRIKVGRFPFAANGRALASGDTEGCVKVIADAVTGEILGVHIFGPNATEMINEAAVLMAMEITAHEIPDIVHAHPTFSEALMESIASCVGKSVHLPSRAKI